MGRTNKRKKKPIKNRKVYLTKDESYLVTEAELKKLSDDKKLVVSNTEMPSGLTEHKYYLKND